MENCSDEEGAGGASSSRNGYGAAFGAALRVSFATQVPHWFWISKFWILAHKCNLTLFLFRNSSRFYAVWKVSALSVVPSLYPCSLFQRFWIWYCFFLASAVVLSSNGENFWDRWLVKGRVSWFDGFQDMLCVFIFMHIWEFELRFWNLFHMILLSFQLCLSLSIFLGENAFMLFFPCIESALCSPQF